MEGELEAKASSGCGFTPFPSDSAGNPYGCAEKRTVFTRRELGILARIREVSQKARSLKARIDPCNRDGASGSRERDLIELGYLREIRLELEKERIAAAEERMRLLGHI